MVYSKKEQLFDKINGLKITDPNLKETWFNWGVKDAYERVEMFFNKELVPEVPQYVADWYEANKDDFEGKLFRCIDCIPSVYNEGDLNEFEEWIIDGETKPFQTLVNMHQFGYKVKEDKKYTVKMVGLSNNLSYLNYDSIGDEWYFNDSDNGHAVGTYHTKKKLEDAGFSNVFDNPMFEVKEVE